VSFSKFERGKYIKGKIMDVVLHEAPLKPDGSGVFEDAWTLLDEISTAGNAETERCANHPLYLRVLKGWITFQEGSPRA